MSLTHLEPSNCDVGFLTLNDHGAILASGGELENDEAKAQIFYRLITMQHKVDNFLEEGCTRVSVNFQDHAYVICLSNNKFYIVKKRISSDSDSEDYLLYPQQAPITNSINA